MLAYTQKQRERLTLYGICVIILKSILIYQTKTIGKFKSIAANMMSMDCLYGMEQKHNPMSLSHHARKNNINPRQIDSKQDEIISKQLVANTRE